VWRAASFVLAEGIRPGNVDQPYVARRLIRRAIRYGRAVGIGGQFLARLAEVALPTLSSAYPELEQRREQICAALDEEEARFKRTLSRGEAEFAKAVGASAARDEATVPGEGDGHDADDLVPA